MSGDVADDDPFDWDVDRVIKELCSPDRTWDAPAASKLPDPVVFSEQLREHDVDGETLLGWADSFDSLRSLCSALGVVKIRHQHSIIQAIKTFRNRSPRWRKWASSEVQQHSDVDMVENHGPISLLPITGSNHSRSLAVADSDAVCQPTQKNSKENSGNDATRGSEAGPSKKRRRIAPITTSTVPTGTSLKALPTEADLWVPKSPQKTSPTTLLYLGAQGEFLGHGKLSAQEILHPASGPSSLGASERSFSWVRTGFLPPARRVQVHHTIKRHLRRDDFPRAKTGDLDPFNNNDEILPAFGDSGDENDYDEATWQEIEEEAKEEDARAAVLKDPHLGAEEVDAIIRQGIEDLKTAWSQNKLPRLERGAHKVWMNARRHSSTHGQKADAKTRVKELDLRIARYCKHMTEQKWPRDDKLKLQQQTKILEQSVFDREYEAWKVRVLGELAAPEKPLRATRHAVRPSKPPKVRKSDNGDEELLTSSSEDDLEDFIVNDELEDVYPDPLIDSNKQTISKHDEKATPPCKQPDMPIAQGVATENSQTEDDTEMLDLTNIDEPPSYADVKAIAEMGTEHWRLVGDNKRQVIAVLYNSAAERRRTILQYALDYNVEDAWDGVIKATLDDKFSVNESPSSVDGSRLPKAKLGFTRIFDLYISGQSDVKNNKPVNEKTARKIESNRSGFDEFFGFLRSIVDFFPDSLQLMPPVQEVATFDAQRSSLRMQNGEPFDAPSELQTDGQTDDETDGEVDNETDEDTLSPSKRRKRRIIRDQAAQNLRETDRNRVEVQEARRKMLREKLKIADSMSQDVTRLIINETRSDEEGFIYINTMIASRIKNHQIAGVRFMWDHLISDSSAKQGCLLAHTMGLGKTMQVITLLVAIAEASASTDTSINSQIPEHLKTSKTLVLCPAGLVNNWMDELLTWTPEQTTLGNLRKIDSSQKDFERIDNVKTWSKEAGVLVIGYEMFTQLADIDELEAALFNSPNIVVGDEAHKIKNLTAKARLAANRFTTAVRIAMTGSPLANNVEEYHSLIDWVAPNYLGPREEFTHIYADPIKNGLYENSTSYDRRKALKMLKVLKETVAPKVHRATMAALREDLPPKKEFILYLKLTKWQFDAYLRFVRHLRGNEKAQYRGNTLFQLTGTLSLLLAHPKIFRAKLEQRKALGRDQENPRSPTAKKSRDELPASVMTLDILSDLLAVLPKQLMEDINRSYKMAVLVKILDQARLMGEKVLVFSQYLETLNYIENLCREQKRLYLRLDGSTATNTRQTDVKQFNSGKDEVYLISTLAGGIGLNIYGASRVVIFDYKFNPIAEQQAIGRAYRIGQTKPVYVYWLVFDGTFERNLQHQAIFKLQLQSRVVDQKNPIARAQQVKEYCRDPVEVVPQNLDHYSAMDRILDAVLEDDTLCGHITSIGVTDTFDEEEPEEQLTAEDSKEVQKMVQLNQLRSRDPEEYRRLEQQDGTSSRIQAPAYNNTSAAGLPLMIREPTPSALERNNAQSAAPGSHLPSAQNQTLSPVSLQSRTDTLHLSPHGIEVKRAQAEIPPPLVVPLLVAASRPSPDSSVSADRSRSAQTLLPESNLPVMGPGTAFRALAAPQNDQSFSDIPGSFTHRFRNTLLYHRGAPGVGVSPERAQELTAEVERIIGQRHPVGLPMKDAQRRATANIANTAILEAFLSGELLAADLVRLQEDQLVALRGKKPSRDSQGATTVPRKGRGDPNHLQNHIRRSLSVKGESRGVHAASDRLAVEAVAARRASQGRPDSTNKVLPDWAVEAVNKRNGGGSTPQRLGDSADLPLTLDD